MDDPIIQIEVALNFLNTLLAKARHFKDTETTKELHTLRHSIYYDDNFNYKSVIKTLKMIEAKLKKYE